MQRTSAGRIGGGSNEGVSADDLFAQWPKKRDASVLDAPLFFAWSSDQDLWITP